MSQEQYVKASGKLVTPTWIVLLLITIAGFSVIAYRFIFGIGAVSNLSDGYPWGVWLGYDVSVGTAFACGGYALAIITYILNGWKYHPMIRSAVTASMFGYALAGFSVVVDLGRFWNMYGFFMPERWNLNSIMFEVAVCIMGYTLVLAIEFTPAIFQFLSECKIKFFENLGKAILPWLDKVMILIVVLGITLPTMHQSSLGSLFIIAGIKLHPLWQTMALPLLFLINALLLGFALVVFESSLSAVGFKRPYEEETLGLTKFIPYVAGLWLVIRFIDLAIRGQIAAMFTSGFYSVFFWIEILLIVSATLIFAKKRLSPRKAFYAAILLCLGGGLYRMSVYLIGFDPGAEYVAYFPRFAEFMITAGIISFEVIAYITFCKVFKLLPRPHTA